MPTRGDVFALAGEQLTDPEAAWSIGTFGAIAEFTCDTGEPARGRYTESSWSRSAHRWS